MNQSVLSRLSLSWHCVRGTQSGSKSSSRSSVAGSRRRKLTTKDHRGGKPRWQRKSRWHGHPSRSLADHWWRFSRAVSTAWSRRVTLDRFCR